MSKLDNATYKRIYQRGMSARLAGASRKDGNPYGREQWLEGCAFEDGWNMIGHRDAPPRLVSGTFIQDADSAG